MIRDLSTPIPLPADYPKRATKKPCKDCGEPIQPGQIYVVDGPLHIGCGLTNRPRPGSVR